MEMMGPPPASRAWRTVFDRADAAGAPPMHQIHQMQSSSIEMTATVGLGAQLAMSM